MTKAKLHDIPARILSIEGKAIFNPHLPNRSEDITPKPPPRPKKGNASHAMTPWKERKPLPGEAGPNATASQSWKDGQYHTGDGEVGIARRIGADDHLQWKSHGDLT